MPQPALSILLLSLPKQMDLYKEEAPSSAVITVHSVLPSKPAEPSANWNIKFASPTTEQMVFHRLMIKQAMLILIRMDSADKILAVR
jgi:hypothetical protein